MSGFWPVVVNVIKNSDVILFIVDARMPELSRNFELENKIQRYSKPIIFVINKTDLLSQSEISELRKRYPKAYLVSGLKNLGFKKLKEGIMIIGHKARLDTVRVGVVGYPNMGKSAVINCLAKGARTKVSSVAGTTRGTQWVRAGSLRVIDSPGVIPFKEREETLGILTAKNPEKLDNPEKVALRLIAFIYKKYPLKAEELIGLKEKDITPESDLLESLGRKRGYLLKGGIVDTNRAAMTLLREWQRGKISLG